MLANARKDHSSPLGPSTVVIFTIERKGDIKGGKGKSAKASRASVVPQTNWKQCVWKSGSYSGTDKGKIKVYVNGIRIMNNTLQRKFIPFQIKKNKIK